MNIAVLSGKGGTGKTFVSVNLAAAMGQNVYADCDVEAPNGDLFFKPENLIESNIAVKVPFFDEEKCNGCKKCVDFCNFNALAYVKNKPLFFPSVCHSCGGCSIICPEGAITEVDRTVGNVYQGTTKNNMFLSGKLNIGEASGMPIISEIMKRIKESGKNAIIDCPPGSGCMVMETVQKADFCILVAEPTSFGCHNLKMVVDLVKVFEKPFAVVLNKSSDEKNPTEEFLKEEKIPILMKIPFESELANRTAKGEIAVENLPWVKHLFDTAIDQLRKKVGR
jgi:MinD superfamily P-loop ATPase